MEKVFQVFVSSTYADLKDERRHVSETLAKAGYIPAGMELFPAADQQQLEFIKRVIDRCDYYVVIVGGRYGSLADDKISFTESEYDYALERDIPVLAFLHASPDDIPVGKTDKDVEKARKLKNFRDRLATGRMIDHWIDPHELCTKVVIAVGQATTLAPGIGWVRGDQAIDPRVLQEAERLRIENQTLKSRLEELAGSEVHFPSHLAGPEDAIEYSIISPDGAVMANVKMGIKDLFLEIFELLVQQAFEHDILTAVATTWAIGARRIDPGDHCPYSIRDLDGKVIRSHLEALGLIQLTAREHVRQMLNRTYHDTYTAWAVTDKGRRYMASLLAVKRVTT